MPKFSLLLTSLFLTGFMTVHVTAGSRIEADPNKKYELSKQRGPWMIMVATLHSTAEDGEDHDGKSPEEAARELVLELRQLGMPAYVFEHVPEKERVLVTDRLGREERRKPQRRYRSICVLAGNYNDINDKIAQDSLEWVKNLHPKCLRDGVYYQPTPGRPGPLSGAFLTINPMLSVEEVEQNRRDPLLVKLNHGERHSLFENDGEYTLIVARFYGKHVAVLPGGKIPGISQFLKTNDLDNAAIAARELVVALRGSYDEAGIFNNIDAYIWHDRHESLVTVGSFRSEDDPAIAQYMQRFGPKVKEFSGGSQALQPEHYALDGFGRKGDQIRLWTFEPEPRLMRVPRMK